VSVRILQWGCGAWGANVLRDLRELGADVTVLARSEHTAQLARKGGAQVVGRLEDAGKVEGVVIVTPAPHHAEAIRHSAPLGCPIFCEKPLVTDSADETALVELCGERLFAMHKWRWHPGIERLEQLAAEGALGEVAGVRSTRLDWGSFHSGVDALDTALSHDLSIGFGILGSIPPVAAARGTSDPRVPRGWAEASILFAGPTGPRFAVEVSSVSAFPLRRVEITGTLGSAVLAKPEAEAIELLIHGGDLERPPSRERLPLEREWPLLRELRDFVAHCSGGPAPRATAAEGFAVVRAIADVRAKLREAPQSLPPRG
jgi:predicted dehydrogenase